MLLNFPFLLQRCSSHLKAQAATIEAPFVHGWVLADKTLAEATFILEKKIAVAVVVQHALSQVEQGAQLTQGVTVRLHLPGIVRHSEKDAAPVGGDVATLVDDVEKAATHNLEKKTKAMWDFDLFLLFLPSLIN